jgi:Fe-S cluster assembly protein SufD
MIHDYKKYLLDRYNQLPLPNEADVLWRFFSFTEVFSTHVDDQILKVQHTQNAGIEIYSLEGFFQKYPDKAQKHLSAAVDVLSRNKAQLFAHVHAQKQWVLYVRAPVCSTEPLIIPLPDACIEHITIIVEQGARVVIHEKMIAYGEQRIKNVDIIIEDGAHLSFIGECRDAQDMCAYLQYNFILYAHAQLITHFAFLGSRNSAASINVHLEGAGAHADIRGLYMLDNDRQCVVSTHQIHRAPNTCSTLLMKGIVADRAQAVYHGTIALAKNAAHSEAYQENKNIVLSNQAKVFSQPNLEIEVDTVRCKHGSAIGRFDAEHLWYLQSRGMPLDVSCGVLLGAFVGEVQHSCVPLADHIKNFMVKVKP